jgi:DNA-binding MarR family transcriptional regulator
MSETDSEGAEFRLDLKDRVGYRFLHLAGQQMRCLAEMYGPRYKLTIAKWKVLSIIGYFKQLSATELGRYTSLEPDKVTRTVDHLVRQGLVDRRQDPADRRRVILSLTIKGKRVNDSIEVVRKAIEVDLLCALEPGELSGFYAILDKLDARAAEIFGQAEAWRAISERHAPSKASSARKRQGSQSSE